MDRKVRIPQALRNFAAGSLFSLISGIAMYISRIVFLKYMTVDYVGYTSLFEHVFLLASVLDSGVATSLTSFMARALIGDDERKKNGVLREARRVYLVVSTLMLTLLFSISLFYFRRKGLFLPSLFYFVGQCAQYYLGWRVLALNASGRNDIVSQYVHMGRTAGAVAEIAVISLTHNFTLYVFVSMVSVVLSYILLFYKAGRVYPWMNEKEGAIDKKEEKYLISIIPSMFSHRFGALFFRCYEIIAVNLVFGFSIGGRYSNMLFISTAFMTVFWIFQNSVPGIVGEHYAAEGRKDSFLLYSKMAYLNLLFSFLAALIFLFFGKKIGEISFGSDNILQGAIPLFLALEMFLNSSRTTSIVFRDAMGDYHRDWWKPIVEAVSVILLTLILSGRLSFYSIPFSISATLLFISVPVDSVIVTRRLKGRVNSSFLPIFVATLLLSVVLLLIGYSLI